MTKRRFFSLLAAAGLNQSKACLDLGIAQSTAWRWPDERVPPYAAAYALLMELLPDDAARSRVRAEMR